MRNSSKLTISGNHIALLETENPMISGYKDKSSKQNRQTEIDPEKRKNTREQTLKKTRSYVRSLINTNNYYWKHRLGKRYNPAFITLTFAEHQFSLDKSNREFSKFIQRLNNFLNGKDKQKLTYVCVIEFQKDIDYYGKTKLYGGNVHYHMIIFNLPYIPKIYDQFKKLWIPDGAINHRSIKDVKKVGSYVCKYMLKDIDNDKLQGRKCYFRSRNLNEPIISKNDLLNQEIIAQLPKEYKTFDKPFDHQYYGKSNFKYFELPYDNPLLKKINGIRR